MSRETITASGSRRTTARLIYLKPALSQNFRATWSARALICTSTKKTVCEILTPWISKNSLERLSLTNSFWMCSTSTRKLFTKITLRWPNWTFPKYPSWHPGAGTSSSRHPSERAMQFCSSRLKKLCASYAPLILLSVWNVKANEHQLVRFLREEHLWPVQIQPVRSTSNTHQRVRGRPTWKRVQMKNVPLVNNLGPCCRTTRVTLRWVLRLETNFTTLFLEQPVRYSWRIEDRLSNVPRRLLMNICLRANSKATSQVRNPTEGASPRSLSRHIRNTFQLHLI